MEDFYKKSEEKLAQQQFEIDSLKSVLDVYTRSGQADEKLAKEMKALFNNVRSVSLARSVRVSVDSLKTDTLTYAIIDCNGKPSHDEKTKMNNWLKARTNAKVLELIVE